MTGKLLMQCLNVSGSGGISFRPGQKVARTDGQIADLADFLESVSSAARFFGFFGSDSLPLVTPTTSDRWCDIAIKGSQGGMNATA
jgi:hypothetical protein